MASSACGAEGERAPSSPPPGQACASIDERLGHVRAAIERGQLDELETVLTRLKTEREGARLEHALRLFLGILQVLPREEATSFEFELLLDLVDQTRDTLIEIIDFLAVGPDERRDLFPIIGQALTECRRDSLILAVRDLFEATDLLEALGEALTDPRVVQLLANIPDQPEQGKVGFVALIRAVFNAIQSPNFDFGRIRDLLGFLDIDEPPVSGLLDALEVYLAGQRLERLRLAVDCFEATQWRGHSGDDVVGAFLYDLVTLDGLDFGRLLSLAAPIIRQLRDPELQTLGRAIIDALVEDLDLRELGIELVVFFIREDNLLPILRSASALFETRAIDDLIRVVEGLTLRCPDSTSDTGVTP